MRESFGGAFIIKLLLIFIIFYISFMAIAINYSKAFRVKNRVINIIEQYQYDIYNVTDYDRVEEGFINPYLESVAYRYYGKDYPRIQNDCDSYAGSRLTTNGACIVPLGADDARYYKIITYIAINFPFFGIELIIPISGETKIIQTSQREEKDL